jgi:hypothetical protein
MSERTPGYYWVTWTERADSELALRRPAPLVAEWDGNVWWLIRSGVYCFDCEVDVLSSVAAPARHEFPRPSLSYSRGADA